MDGDFVDVGRSWWIWKVRCVERGGEDEEDYDGEKRGEMHDIVDVGVGKIFIQNEVRMR